ALAGMFNEMNLGLKKAIFEPNGDIALMVRTFLHRFDALFTLNQDLLFEYHYLDENLSLSHSRRWAGGEVPGVKPLNPSAASFDPTTPMRATMHTIGDEPFQVSPSFQPYFKLHGSSNFVVDGAGRVLVLGGNKVGAINRFPLLQWYHAKFVEYLNRG